MTQRAIIFETDEETGAKSVYDIHEWDDDNLQRNKRRLFRECKERLHEAIRKHQKGFHRA